MTRVLDSTANLLDDDLYWYRVVASVGHFPFQHTAMGEGRFARL